MTGRGTEPETGGPADGTAPDGPTDEDLMRAYGAGDAAAFDGLFRRYRRPLFTFLLHRTGSRSTAEDLFQEVFLRVIRGRGRYRPTGSFRSWLFTIAHNAATDDRRRAGLRSAERTEVDDVDEPERRMRASRDAAADPVARTHARDLRERIEVALARLPADQREVFLLRERAGLEFRHIAEVTGCGLATAKSRMRYALAGLRRVLAAELASIAEGSHE